MKLLDGILLVGNSGDKSQFHILSLRSTGYTYRLQSTSFK